MIIPTQFVIYCDTKIFAVVYKFEDVAMDLIFINLVGLFSSYSKDALFLRVELDLEDR